MATRTSSATKKATTFIPAKKTEIFDIVRNGDLEGVMSFIRNGGDVNKVDKNGSALLHHSESKEISECLISQGADRCA